jgi:hypothetical protein
MKFSIREFYYNLSKYSDFDQNWTKQQQKLLTEHLFCTHLEHNLQIICVSEKYLKQQWEEKPETHKVVSVLN